MTAHSAHRSPDHRLLMDVAAGNHSAFETFYHRYATRVYHYLLSLLRDPSAAEEALADVMVAVWDSAKTYKGESQVSTWLLGIARHKAIDTLRRVSRHEMTTVPLDHAAEQIDPHDGPIELLVQEALAAQTKQALEQLSPEHREALYLAFYQEMPYQDIASLLNIPVNTVKTRVFYAKQQLKQVLLRVHATEPLQ